ncbi:hypothetical protein CPLU01_12262 [Colletotrichum plurivorum]|uniref:Uncharacterized protein n=1 Tax=Colletotrichum plurivorum TaxID=2175906 RepID=A0A8H6N6B6_9PEZI|nr:hypothetical protein CPLU01_12262 [Colletotrichum plurivorum]
MVRPPPKCEKEKKTLMRGPLEEGAWRARSFLWLPPSRPAQAPRSRSVRPGSGPLGGYGSRKPAPEKAGVSCTWAATAVPAAAAAGRSRGR